MPAATHAASPHAPLPRIGYLDGWRGISILLVLLHHFGAQKLDMLGHIGVDSFFVLSGVLMCRILFVERMPIRTFYQRRVARIFPVMYLYLIVLSLLGAAGWMGGVNLRYVLYTGLFVRAYYPASSILDQPNGLVGHFWSLNIEEHCYVLLSLVALASRGRSEAFARWLVTLGSIGCVFMFGYYAYHPTHSLSPPFARTECGGFPMLVSCAFFLWLRRYPLKVPAWLPVAATLAGIATGVTLPEEVRSVISPFFLALGINTLPHAPAWMHKILNLRVLAWFGLCSFSLYVCQQPFYAMGLHWHTPAGWITSFLMAFAAGVGCHYLYERPMRRWIGGKAALRQGLTCTPSGPLAAARSPGGV